MVRASGGNDADCETEIVIYLTHPCSVAAREIIVHRDNLYAFAGKRMKGCWQRSDKRLSLASAHFSDVTLSECKTADKLHIEMTLAARTMCRFAHKREH